MRIFFLSTYLSGVGYYRINNPAMMIKKLGLAEVITNPFKVQMLDETLPKSMTDWHEFIPDEKGEYKSVKLIEGVFQKYKIDAMVIQRMDSAAMLSLALAIQKHYKIPVIQENDDYVLDVPPKNPGVLEYHEKRVGLQSDSEDPMTTFRKSLGVFDGYIVSTPFLQKFHGQYSPAYVCPNSIDVSKRKPKPYKKHKDIRIMFSSSAGHWDNLELIKSHIIKILDKYPNTTFYQYDFLPLISEDKKYKGRIKTMKWVHPDKYWKYINSFSPDICLAPLTDSLYNRAKSNLRLLEYWTSGNNLVIASPIGHYKETIVDGKNGLFARNSEWFDKIEYAIQHPELRERLGKGGRKTVEKDYNLEKNARLWVDAVRSIIKNYKPDKQAPEQYIAPEFK